MRYPKTIVLLFCVGWFIPAGARAEVTQSDLRREHPVEFEIGTLDGGEQTLARIQYFVSPRLSAGFGGGAAWKRSFENRAVVWYPPMYLGSSSAALANNVFAAQLDQRSGDRFAFLSIEYFPFERYPFYARMEGGRVFGTETDFTSMDIRREIIDRQVVSPLSPVPLNARITESPIAYAGLRIGYRYRFESGLLVGIELGGRGTSRGRERVAIDQIGLHSTDPFDNLSTIALAAKQIELITTPRDATGDGAVLYLGLAF